MAKTTDYIRKQQLLQSIGEALKKPKTEIVPKAPPQKGSSIKFCEEDCVIELKSTEEDIELLGEVLTSLIQYRKGC